MYLYDDMKSLVAALTALENLARTSVEDKLVYERRYSEVFTLLNLALKQEVRSKLADYGMEPWVAEVKAEVRGDQTLISVRYLTSDAWVPELETTDTAIAAEAVRVIRPNMSREEVARVTAPLRKGEIEF